MYMKEQINILLNLEKDWKTTTQLTKETGLSEKTIRNKLKHLKEEMRNSGAYIEAKSSKGFRLLIEDEKKYSEWKRKYYLHEKDYPDGKSARYHYILAKLLFGNSYFKRAQFSEDLYVSEKTISNDMKEVIETLQQYDLKLDMKPNYGYKVIGSEFNIRQCLLNCVISPLDNKDLVVQKKVTMLVQNCIVTNNMNIPSYLTDAIIDYLAIATKRIREGILIDDAETKKWDKHVGIFYVAIYLMGSMVNEGLISSFNEAEAYYVSLYLWGNRTLDQKNFGVDSFVVPTHIKKISNEMKQILENHYNLMIPNESYMNCLIIHTVSAEIRGKYNIQIYNKQKDKLMMEYPMAYYVASKIVKPLEDYLNKKLSSDEVSFYALLLLELMPKLNYKLDCAFIYDSERVEDYALIHRVNEKLNDLLSIKRKYMISEIGDINYEDYQIILTTQPIEITNNVIKLNYDEVMSDLCDVKKQIQNIYYRCKKKYILSESGARQDNYVNALENDGITFNNLVITESNVSNVSMYVKDNIKEIVLPSENKWKIIYYFLIDNCFDF